MPVLAAVVVTSLAAGIGVNTIVFSWIQSRVFKPLPAVEDGANFHGIEPRSAAGLYAASSWLEYEDMARSLRTFASVIAARSIPAYVGDAGHVERVFGSLVSENYFEALGVRPAAGRFFTRGEAASRQPVVVIGYGLWQSRFAGAADVVGRRLRVNGVDLTIAGVTPEPFQGTTLGLNFELWMPAAIAPLVVPGTRELDERAVRGYSVLGRITPPVTRAQAQAEVDALMAQLATAYPATNAEMKAEVLPFWQSPRGPQRLLVNALVVLQAIMLVLLVAVCGNTANLILARASARQREIGICLALGSGPWRVARLLLAETSMLALMGAAAGAAVAVWGTNALQLLPLTGLPLRLQTSVDAMGLAFAMTLGLLCGAAAGAVPALQFARMDPLEALRSGLRASSRSSVRSALMGVQVALALIVLLAAGVFMRSFQQTQTDDTGFGRHGVLLAAYDLAGRNVKPADARVFADRLVTALRGLPGVESAAIASSVPLDIHGLPMRVFTLEGRAREEAGYDEALTNTVTPGYFEVMQIPLLAGAGFAPLTDQDAPPQAVVNQAFVDRYVGEGTAVGRSLEARGGRYVIAGVVATSLYNAFGEPPTPIIYFSYRDRPGSSGEIHLRTREGEEDRLTEGVRETMRGLDSDLPVFNVRTLDRHVETNLIFRRVPARMFAFLGPLLLMLAAMGIYAVAAYNMSLRTTEIGLRLALGATPRRVVREFVVQSMGVILTGAVIGWLIAVVIAMHLAGGALDLAVFTGVPALLLAVAVLACWIPAHRAAKRQPWRTLRA
jgi:predicted permease